MVPGRVHDIRFSPDGRWIAAAGNDALLLWSVETGFSATLSSGCEYLFPSYAGKLDFSPSSDSLLVSEYIPGIGEMNTLTIRLDGFKERIHTEESSYLQDKDEKRIHSKLNCLDPILIRGQWEKIDIHPECLCT